MMPDRQAAYLVGVFGKQAAFAPEFFVDKLAGSHY